MRWQDIDGFSPGIEDVYRRAMEDIIKIDDTVVEVGVYAGRSLCMLATLAVEYARTPLRIYGVDLFDNTPPGEPKSYYSETEKNLAEYREHVTLVQDDSAKAAERFITERPVFVFIDACHEYESIKKDIEAWKRVLRPGGVLAGHDCRPDFDGVVRAVNELLPGHEIMGKDVDSCFWWHKP